jgi:glycosyltransferase involved in cell wall biosynthesis
MTAVQTLPSHSGDFADRPLNNRKPNLFLMVNTLETGGSERQFINVVNALGRERFNVRLGCLKRVGAFLSQIADIEEFDRGSSFYTLKAQRTRFDLGRYLRNHEVAVAHSFDFYANVMLIPAARLAGVPVVIGSHRQLGDLLTPMKRRVQGGLFRLCDRVVCNSQAASKALIDRGLPSSKIVVIPNAVSDSAFAGAEPALARSSDVLRVGMIARMNDRSKNHVAFLRVAAQLVTKVSNVEFLLVGDGPLRPSLERMAQDLGLASRTRFLGAREDIPAVLAAMDILVLPSLSESLPNVVIESMAAGVPVIATSVGGIPELVREGETGFLIPPEDDNRFVAALEHLLMCPGLRADFGGRGRKLAFVNYSLSRIRDRYEELYTSLLAEKLGCRSGARERRW